MIQHTLHGVTLEAVQGDIVQQPDVDAIVNAANAALRPGGGVAGAIHRAAGPGLAAECRPLASIRPSEAVITRAHDLPNHYVIHCLGPVYGVDERADRLLAAGYRRALRLAEEKEINSSAFPAISTGAFGYPLDPATEVTLATVQAEPPALSSVRHVRFVLWDDAAYQVYPRHLERLTQDSNPTDR